MQAGEDSTPGKTCENRKKNNSGIPRNSETGELSGSGFGWLLDGPSLIRSQMALAPVRNQMSPA